MGQIKILDTGYIKTSNSGTQASDSNRANDGKEIIIKVGEFSPGLIKNLTAKPDIGTNVPSEVNQGSLNNMTFRLRCVFIKNNVDDMNSVNDVINAIVTRGYKLLWYEYDDATVEKNSQSLLAQIASNPLFGDSLTSGEQTAFDISSAFNTLHVLFKSITKVDSGKKGQITYDIQGIVLPVEDSVI